MASLWIVLYYVLEMYQWLLIARAVLSWFGPSPTHPAVALIGRVTDPVLQPIASLLPPLGGVDLSPIVAFFLIELVQGTIV